MAFAIRNLSVLAYANGFTFWHYRSGKDTVAAITDGNYFSDAADMLTAGDVIMAAGTDGTTMRVVSLSNYEAVVTAPLV